MHWYYKLDYYGEHVKVFMLYGNRSVVSNYVFSH